MKSAFVLCGLAALATFSSAARAGDLIPELVPADARWLAHLDLEALQKSALFQAARENDAEFHLDQGLEEFQRELGADPFELVRSVTLFSTRAEPETGVAVLTVGEKAEEVLAKLQQQPGFRTVQANGRELLTWNESHHGDGGEPAYAYVRRFEGVANRLVYVSNREDDLMAAIDVLESKKPDVTDDSLRRLSASPGPNSILFVATSERIPGLDGVERMSAVAALADGLRFDLGETNGQLHAQLVVTAKDAHDARNITSVLQGVSALASLIGSEHGGEEIANLVRGLGFTTNGNEVAVELRYDSRKLIQTLHGLHAEDEEHEFHGGHGGK